VAELGQQPKVDVEYGNKCMQRE